MYVRHRSDNIGNESGANYILPIMFCLMITIMITSFTSKMNVCTLCLNIFESEYDVRSAYNYYTMHPRGILIYKKDYGIVIIINMIASTDIK